MRYYAGIGSRKTPQEILLVMEDIAVSLAEDGFVLRSGGADGADSAFESGCSMVNGMKEIWLPWPGFNNNHTRSSKFASPEHEEIASQLHPAWSRLTQGPRKLHSRNVGQVLGENVFLTEDYSKFVICYTPDGAQTATEVTHKTGGTGTAIKLASYKGIPVFNLRREDSLSRLTEHLKGNP